MKKKSAKVGGRLLRLLVSVCIAAGCVLPGGVPVSAESGSCGSGTTWNLTDGVLTLGGSGEVQVVAWSLWKSKITSIVIEDGVTGVPKRVFSGSKLLRTISFGKSMKALPDGVCADCEALSSVSLSEGVQSIGPNAFQNCYELDSVTFPSTLKTIGDKAFYACLDLKALTLPDAVTSVGSEAFKGNNVKKLTLGNSLQTIGSEAFNYSCFSEVTIPDSVRQIGSGAFGIVYVNVTRSGSTLYFDTPSNESKVTLIGKAGGTAQNYAKSEGLNFREPGAVVHTHEWSAWKVKTPAGCESEGVEERSCKGCKETETRTIPATGHQMGDWTIEKAPGCETEGMNVRVCTVCGKNREEQIIPAMGHQMGDWTVEKAPGCETEGMNVRVCTVCGKNREEQITQPTGHDWGEWQIAKEPTLEEAGERQRSCKNCNAVSTELIPKIAGWTVSVASGEGGTVSPSGEIRVIDGGSLTLQITADQGWQLVSVNVSGTELQPDANGSLIISDIREDKTVLVAFRQQQQKTRKCNLIEVTPNRRTWFADEEAFSMSDFTVYANITDRYEIAWEDIAADCVPEGKPEPGETYGKCIVRFRYQGSDPEIRAYAEENGISAEIPLYLRGDCDLNGITDVADAQKALKTYVILLSGLKEDGLQDIQRAVMDVDRNGVTELEDAAYILQYYTKSMAGLNPDWKTIMKQN